MVEQTHFTEAELDCKCRSCHGKKPPEKVRVNLRRAMAALEGVRQLVGRPVIVTSGYRCPPHNREVGGASQSEHLSGLAVDFKVKGYTGAELKVILEEAISSGVIPDGGIGVYRAFPRIVHYDLGKPRRWAHQ